MKSAMPFHGVGATAMRAACRRAFSAAAFGSASEWRDAVRAIWHGATHREERYGAIELTGLRIARPWQTFDALPLYEELVVTGAWWDYVDAIAGHRLGELLRRDPVRMKRAMRRWSRADDLWKRRASILCQLTFKRETDLDLLYACIEPSIGSPEFFLRKGIGWALRQYAWVNPGEILRYVREHEARLSPLTKREALKNVTQREDGPTRPRAAGRGRA